MSLNKNITNRQFLLGDTDKDGVPNIDDQYPLDPKRDNTVEETLLSEEIADIRKYAIGFRADTIKVCNELKSLGFKIQYRIKGTYSIINKLKRKYLKDIQDIGGVAVLVETPRQAYDVLSYIKKNYHVLTIDDYFEHPKDEYYRAIHATIEIKRIPVEIQIKTVEEAELHLKAHTLYKKGKLTEKHKKKFARQIS